MDLNTFLEILQFKPIVFINPLMQIIIVLVLIALTFYIQRNEYEKTGKTYGRYPWRISTIFSSIYEEIIFRGFILFSLFSFLTPIISVVVSSILFGLWHIKNHKWQTKEETVHQVVYTGVLFGPIACLLTLWTGTVWLAVIIHYLHNLLVDTYRKIKLNGRVIS